MPTLHLTNWSMARPRALRNAARIARVLGVSLDEIVGEERG